MPGIEPGTARFEVPTLLPSIVELSPHHRKLVLSRLIDSRSNVFRPNDLEPFVAMTFSCCFRGCIQRDRLIRIITWKSHEPKFIELWSRVELENKFLCPDIHLFLSDLSSLKVQCDQKIVAKNCPTFRKY